MAAVQAAENHGDEKKYQAQRYLPMEHLSNDHVDHPPISTRVVIS